MIVQSEFKPLWWLRNCHAQTLYPTFTNRLVAPITAIEKIELPDGDFLELAWAAQGLDKDTPLVIILHGLGGGLGSAYVGRLLTALNSRGYRAAMMQFRGGGDMPNRKARAYHSGETADLDFVLAFLEEREPYSDKGLIGVSLGGNVLLKWLGENPRQQWVDAAVAVSVPYQLEVVSSRISQGLSQLYERSLLKGLQQRFAKKIDMVSQEIPLTLQQLFAIKTLREFDECVTAPLHGFAHAADYYQRSSCSQFLAAIQTPALLIHALDDPFMTASIIPTAEELSPTCTLELCERGGHVGFISALQSNPHQPDYWLAQRIPAYFSEIWS